MTHPAVDAQAWAITSKQVNPNRVEATVDGVPVWVESHDAPLVDAPEAWGTAFALPSARAGAGLAFSRPIDDRWAVGGGRNVELTSRWWGGEPEPAWRSPAPRVPAFVRRIRARRAAGVGLCFTGGVDSFFSLLGDQHRPTCLLYVVGFDVDLDDQSRIDDVLHIVRSVALDRGLRAIVVRTDLRQHPLFASISWEHTHGAALAAIGHLISSTIGTLVIPPSYSTSRLVPWGSRPDLDPAWSVPGRLDVVHGDASGSRLDRVRAIAQDPLARRHLRVCWQNVGTELNCGRCEKCVRTMAMLDSVGVLDEFETFPGRAELTGRIDAFEAISAGVIPLWEDMLAIEIRPEVKASIADLIERSSAS